MRSNPGDWSLALLLLSFLPVDWQVPPACSWAPQAPVPRPHLGSLVQDSPPLSRPLRAVPIAVADEGESESEEDDLKPRGNSPRDGVGTGE